MKFFQQTLLPDPLGTVLSRARRAKHWSLAEAARAAGVSEAEAEAFEEDRILDRRMARLHAASYARALGMDLREISQCLPPAPSLDVSENAYLAKIAHPEGSRRGLCFDVLHELLRPLAPLGRAVVYLLLVMTFLGAWGAIRQLSRIRSIPWITDNSLPAVFHDR